MIDAQKFAQPRCSRGGRTPLKITMSRKTREQAGQIVRIGPGGQLSAFVDWACQLLLYTLGDDTPELPFAIRGMLTAVIGEDAEALAHTSAHLEVLSLHLWAIAQELSGGPSYHLTREVITDVSEELSQ